MDWDTVLSYLIGVTAVLYVLVEFLTWLVEAAQ